MHNNKIATTKQKEKKDFSDNNIALSQTASFRNFQTKRACRRRFQIL